MKLLKKLCMSTLKIPVIGILAERFIYNRRHLKFDSMYNVPFIRKTEILNEDLKVTDCSNCMICCYQRLAYIPLNTDVIKCNHLNNENCNSNWYHR